MQKLIIVLLCITASIYANKVSYDFQVKIDQIEYTKLPQKYNFDTHLSYDSLLTPDVVKEIGDKVDK